MKKIGILTIHDSTNFGANLQAFALNRYLNDCGFDAKTIDYIHPTLTEQDIKVVCGRVLKNYRKQGVVPVVKTLLKMPSFIRKTKPIISKFNQFRREYLPMTEPCYEAGQVKGFDHIVVGSDQVWNPDITKGVDRVYFAQGIECPNIFSYAPSVGKKEFDGQTEEKIRQFITNFNQISVREEDTARYLERLSGRQVEVVADPTFLIDKKIYEELAKKINRQIKERYILIYNVVENPSTFRVAENIAERSGEKIVRVSNGKFKDAGVTEIKGGPIEFLNAFYYADHIVTNSFHGLAFSIIFEKDFYVIDNKARGSRITNLLQVAGLSDRLAEGELPKEGIDYTQVKEAISPLIESSKKYIADNLS